MTSWDQDLEPAVVGAYRPSNWEVKQEDQEFKDILGKDWASLSSTRPCLKSKRDKQGMVLEMIKIEFRVAKYRKGKKVWTSYIKMDM